MNWNFNMDDAPRSHYERRKAGKGVVSYLVPHRLLCAGPDGLITISYYIPDEDRWNMFSAKQNPLAWMELPKHPGEAA